MEVFNAMDSWNKNGRRSHRVSPVVGWTVATLNDSEGDVFLRLEFSVSPDNTDVSALQFALSERQARDMSAELEAVADWLSARALQPN